MRQKHMDKKKLSSSSISSNQKFMLIRKHLLIHKPIKLVFIILTAFKVKKKLNLHVHKLTPLSKTGPVFSRRKNLHSKFPPKFRKSCRLQPSHNLEFLIH